ncbi:MAG: hypothetical protein IPO22_05170 [Anaerolineales bacterium]|nr:hypothetical protein [Anaerolineales bacterium]
MLIYKKIIPLTLLLISILSTLTFAQPAVAFADVPDSNAVPQTTPAPSVEETAPSGPPLSLTLSLLCFCLAFSLLIGVFVLGVFVRMPGRKDKDIEKIKEEHGL